VDHAHIISDPTGLAARATWRSVWVNLALALAQVAVGWVGHSQALLADGLHSLSDLISDFVVLVAARSARVEADDSHPYGHGRFENAASLLLGLIMIGVGVGMVVAAAERLQSPASIRTVLPMTLAVAVVTLLTKELLFRYMLAVGQRLRSSLLVANAWHARSDAAASLVAAVGILCNLLGIGLADALAAVVVGCMIARMGGQFALRAILDLTDHALAPEEVQAIRTTLAAVPGVEDVHALRTRKMADDALVDAHVRVADHLTVSEGHRIAEAARAAVIATHRVLDALIHIDPEDDANAAGLIALPAREAILAMLEQEAGPVVGDARVLLHYLDCAVEVDMLFPVDYDAAALAKLSAALPAIRARHGWVRDIRLFEGRQTGG